MIADSSGSVARAAALEALQAFTGERTATRAIGIAMHQYPDTRTALLNTIAPGRRYGSSWMRWTR